MRIALHSDLHMEFGEEHFYPRPEAYADADVIVLAGDVHLAKESPQWIVNNFGPVGKPVVYVAGNHEYYHGHWENSLEFLRAECGKHPWLHFLEDGEYVHGSTRFLGCTLWTDFTLNGDPARGMMDVECGLNDYRSIRSANPVSWNLGGQEVRSRNWSSRKYLDERLTDRPDGVTQDIVVTHHAPHINSISQDYVEDHLRPGYATDLTAIMQEHRPRYWLHGHIHVPAAYTVDHTDVRSNPAGYPHMRGLGAHTQPLMLEC